MVERRRRPGSPKGQPKPAKRQLDQGFAKRLKGALANRPELEVPDLAKKVGCTRAVLHKHLAPGKSKTIEALLLFEIADALHVSARWLLKGSGAMAKVESLTPEQGRVLNIHSLLDEGHRDFWTSQGEELLRRHPAVIATTGNPYTGSGERPPESRSLHEPAAIGTAYDPTDKRE